MNYRVNIKVIIISFICILIVGYACHTPNLSATRINSEDKIILPKSEITLPAFDFSFYLPKPRWEMIGTPLKDITLTLSLFDRSHVRVNDPKLFNDNNTEIIDLATLSQDNYSFPLPGAKVISPYAGRRKNHTGIDIKIGARDTIVAAFDGIVRMAKPYAAYGNVIVIRHYNGLETVYSHNSKHLVKDGDKVIAGQPIAITGRTGRATTEHLHFETRINGQHFNPELVFDFDSQQLQTKSLLCVQKNNGIIVSQVDPFPYQLAGNSNPVDLPLSVKQQEEKNNLN